MIMLSLKLLMFTFLFNQVLMFDDCDRQKTCQECIRHPDQCVYCSQINFNGTRCRSNDVLTDETWCPNEHIENPRTRIQKPKDDNFTSELGRVIQLKPQNFKIDLRIGDTFNFTFSYKGAEDYPIDIYFLLDASRTMKKIKNATIDKSEDIYKTMNKLTKNVTLGIGTFIDKNTLPFTVKLNSTNTYSFRNNLNLTNSYQEFKKVLQDIVYGGNHDDPEGGLDALAQVIACKDLIGWRNESRKIIVFLTDSSYHAAGDGSLGGITQPYDGKCYTENNTYTKELEMDYPSVGMINKLATEEEIIIFFAIHGEKQVYKHLSRAISGSKYAEFSDNIVKDLKKIYEDITKNIILKVNIKSEFKKLFHINFDPKCTEGNTDKNCNAELGKEKKITGSIKLLDYVGEDNVQIDVIIQGIKEKLKLDIHVIKECDCEVVYKSEHCSNYSPLNCGLCICNVGRYGEKCECSNAKNMPEQQKKCKIGGTNEDEDCSGRGSCVCGICQCLEGYEGRFCQCNKNLCKTGENGVMCNAHGKCYCGKCRCDDEWTGSDCACAKSEKACLLENGKLCNNRGRCECGKCQCDKIARWDARQIQNKKCIIKDCPKCHEQQCNELTECVLCHHNQKNICYGVCHSDIKVNVTTNITHVINEGDKTGIWMECDVRVDIACYSKFLYKYDNDNYLIELVVTTERDCAESYYMFGGISLAVLILIGIITIVAWKLLTDARDRYEYERFLKHQEETNDSVIHNPTYIPPSTTICNPTFEHNEFQ